MEKPKILFVDDERQILISLRAVFRNDYRVFIANSGAEAIDIIRREQIDAIISDQRMPNMQGHELLRRVKKISPATMRLLLTGYSDLSAIMSSINDGEIFRFIHKPWNNSELRALVESAVKIARATREGTKSLSQEDNSPLDILPIDPEPTPNQKVRAIANRATPGRAPISTVHGISADRATLVPAARVASAAPRTPAPINRPAPRLNSLNTAPPEATETPTRPAILVLDEKLDSFTRLREVYQAKYPVRLAHTLEKAIEILDEDEVGLLVTDVQLNGEDNTDFIKLLKQQYPMILTLVLTDIPDSDLAIELINQGRIYRYLRKPVGDSTLKLSINQGMRFYIAHKQQPELLGRQKTEKIREIRNPTLSERMFGRLRALKQRFSFGF